jgi:hypothetical protein
LAEGTRRGQHGVRVGIDRLREAHLVPENFGNELRQRGAAFTPRPRPEIIVVKPHQVEDDKRNPRSSTSIKRILQAVEVWAPFCIEPDGLRVNPCTVDRQSFKDGPQVR